VLNILGEFLYCCMTFHTLFNGTQLSQHLDVRLKLLTMHGSHRTQSCNIAIDMSCCSFVANLVSFPYEHGLSTGIIPSDR
jgi:hypothetical protein